MNTRPSIASLSFALLLAFLTEAPILTAQNCLPGGITFTTQAEIDAFPTNYPGCTHIQGNVTINDGDNNAFITNLNGLSNITSIGGSLIISSGCDGLPNLEGLNNLMTIGVDFTIFDCDAMINLSGLNNLTTIGRRLQISASDALVNLNGLDNLLSTGGYFYVHNNDALTSLNGLGSLDSVGGYLDISSHDLLTSLNGLGPLTTIGTQLYLSNSPNLAVCNTSGICDYLNNPANPASIHTNAPGCNTRIEIETTCANPDCPPNLVLTSQAQVDAFPINYPNCTMISGNVTINDGDNNADITNLDGLSNITSIGGNLEVFSGCDGLTDLTGLNNLTSVGGTFEIFDCDAMLSLSGLNNLTAVGDRLRISASDALTNLVGLESLLSVGDNADINSNNAMTSMDGLTNLSSVGGSFSVYDNPLLTNIEGVESLTAIGNNLSIFENPLLSICSSQGICDYLNNPANSANIHTNAAGCNTRIEVEAACEALPKIRYVRQGGSGTGDGSSWANASADLQAMLSASSSAGDQVWVAAGTYKPTTGTDVYISFVMNNNVAVYGGFPASGDPDMSDRDWTAYPTILSGDIGTPNDMGDNTRDVLDIYSVSNSAVLDGFTIRDGVSHAINNAVASPTLTNCSFLNNNVGIFLGGGSPILTNCVFADNKLSSLGFGSGIVSFSGSMTLNNCIFNNNIGNALGLISADWFILNNCTIANNGGITNNSADGVTTMNNCIIWGNGGDQLPASGIVVTHSVVEGGYLGTGNLDEDPLFVDAANRDYRLQAGSPAIDAGTADDAPAFDLDGNPRPAGCGYDMGAYEYQGDCTPDISGKLIWEHDDASGVGNALVSLSGDPTGSMTTTAAGTFSFTVASGSSLTLTPTKTVNKLNGVTTADATRIQQHVSNSNPLTDPYKIVAADVNKSNSVTTQDASVIMQALLGNPAALAQFKTSWRFVPTSHTMNNPPWGFPENITLNHVQNNVSEQNFFGIKTGDVLTPYTNPANFNGASTPEFVLNMPDQSLQFGEQVTVAFSANQFSDLTALQFALKFDVEKLALVKIEPLAGLPVSEENFGTYNISEGEINVAWSQAEGVFVDEAAPIFKLTFNVLETGGKLSEVIQLADEVLEGHAYTSTLTDNKVALHFFGTTSSNAPIAQPQVQLLQNRPNPFVSQTTIGFVLPESCEAQLRILDVSGRVLFSQKKNYAAGRHEETLELGNAGGVLWYELTTPFGILTKKMVGLEK